MHTEAAHTLQHFCSVAQANFRPTIINFHLSSYIIHSLRLWCLLKYFIFNFKFSLCPCHSHLASYTWDNNFWKPHHFQLCASIFFYFSSSFSFSSALCISLSPFAFASWFLTFSICRLNTFLSLVKWKQVPSASLEITVVQNPLQLNEFSDSHLRSAKSYKMFRECVRKCERKKKFIHKTKNFEPEESEKNLFTFSVNTLATC